MGSASIVAVWFTFSRDHWLVRMSVESFQRIMPGVPCVIADEAHSPIPPQARRELMDMGCDYLETGFSRGRNLRGTECIVGMLETMHDACKRHGATHALKIDSDVLWNRKTWLDPLTVETAGVGFGSNRRGWFGASYAIRKDLLPKLRRAVLNEPWRCCQPEDLTIYRHLEPYGPIKHFYDHSGGAFAGWLYDKPATPERIRLYLDRFDLITVGNRTSLEVKEETMKLIICVGEQSNESHL